MHPLSSNRYTAGLELEKKSPPYPERRVVSQKKKHEQYPVLT